MLRTVWLTTLLLLTGCQASQDYPQDQRIEGPFQITKEWRTIRFDTPLAIDREGIQKLRFIVDPKKYVPNGGHHPANPLRHFSLRQKSDGVLIIPEVVLVGNGGQEVAVHPTGNTFLYAGGVTINFGPFTSLYEPPPPFPEEIENFRAVRVRSNLPFTAEYLHWNMEGHPDFYRCGGYCSWWRELFL